MSFFYIDQDVFFVIMVCLKFIMDTDQAATETEGFTVSDQPLDRGTSEGPQVQVGLYSTV